MKRIIFSLLLVVVAFNLQAQHKVAPAYWVVETNSKLKNYSIVRLYDSNNQLVHEVRMDGIYFDVTRTKHRKKLDLLLNGYFSPDVVYDKHDKVGEEKSNEVQIVTNNSGGKSSFLLGNYLLRSNNAL